MTKIFNYSLEELNKMKKRNIILAIVFISLSFLIPTLLIIFHDRSNSLLFNIISIISNVLFLIFGLSYILIINEPVKKMIQIIKQEDNAIRKKYKLVSISEDVFSMNGIAFKKLELISDDNSKEFLYLEKNVKLEDEIKYLVIGNVNSIIVDYEVLK